MGKRFSRARKSKRRNTRQRKLEAMAMAIFSANPKSFKLRRNSTMASNLKSSVSVKLLDFLSELTDDVFAEYITILVCNGKNQYQAREDLDAFLGENTDEFVSWLWCHLLDYLSTHSAEIRLKNHNGVSDTSCQAYSRDDGPRTRRNNRGSNLDDGLLRFQNDTSSKVEPTKDIVGEALPHDSSAKDSSPVISANRDQFAPHAKKPKQMLDRKLYLALGEISLYSTRDPVVNCPQSSVLDYTCSRQDFVNNAFQGSVSLSPSLEGKLEIHTENNRVSVWDRLGRPSDNISAEVERVHLDDVDIKKQYEVVHNQHSLVASGLDCEAYRLENRSVAHSYHDDSEKLQNFAIRTFDLHPANSVKRKRLCGETSDNLNLGSVPSKDMRKSMSPVKEISRNTSPSLALKMLDIKQRLQKMETEMYMLRSKQAKKGNDVNHSQMANSSELKLPEEDVDSRTIFVTNVHFAATKAALSSFFAKCGVVVNVVKMVDPVTAKPKGFAYVTFAGKDSVEEALALSGTTLLSRIVKVSRKSEADAAASVPAHFAEKPFRATPPNGYTNSVPNKPYYHSASRLQWRRANSIVPSHL